ncbi:periplasmic nitrate reductase, NapE protein [Nitratireductor sp. CAU 1489]|uniref:Periplasmic nitrate reductase, NapE protein n=1 Tax=Nitratireductor arenosus TaxID=2682096 RepID=A0A844QKL0_9HYPH|nr:periplasmic nitrate reductase, NapE protein [Nitratireductor arenosus]MVA98189.1 periplasmic nitrate reductase, NapE protein [Nitratireductor arenosus]
MNPDKPTNDIASAANPTANRRKELLAFLVLAFGIWPGVAVGVVGGYGFLVWMWQIVFGPPGPPGG